MDWSSQTAAGSPLQPIQVTVNISELDGTETIPERFVTIQQPDWSISIGRGSMTEPGLSPSPENAWFTSRVMSRNHAILRANPVTKQLYIEDIGSMHGTQLDGSTITKGVPQAVAQDSILTFGTQVVRGTDSYNPLRIQLAFDWSYDSVDCVRQSSATQFYATAVADVQKEMNDNRASEDVEVVFESVKQPSVEIISHSKTFRVPDDDSSSIVSLDDDSVEDHPSSPSDPTDLSDFERKANQENTDGDEINSEEDEDADYDPEQPVEHHDIFSDEDHYYEEVDYDDDDDNDNEEEVPEDQESDYEVDVDDLLQAAQIESKHGLRPLPQSVPSFGYILRDPSPSDAAMAKSSSTKLPEVQSTAFSRVDSFPEVYDRTSSPTYDATSEMQGSTFDGSSPQVQAPGIGFDYNAFKLGNAYNPISLPPLQFDPSGLPTLSSLSPPPKQGIQSERKELPSTDQKMKRKADQISTSGPEYPFVISPNQSEVHQLRHDFSESLGDKHEVTTTGASLQFHHTPTNVPSDEIKESEISTLPSIVVVDSEVNEPPRKKVKTGKERYRQQPKGSSFVRYAATALAGIAVGAVGTVFGLAALPTDFFA